MAYGTMGGDGQPQIAGRDVHAPRLVSASRSTRRSTRRAGCSAAPGARPHTNLRMESRFDGNLIDRLMSAGHDVEVLAERLFRHHGPCRRGGAASRRHAGRRPRSARRRRRGRRLRLPERSLPPVTARQAQANQGCHARRRAPDARPWPVAAVGVSAVPARPRHRADRWPAASCRECGRFETSRAGMRAASASPRPRPERDQHRRPG